ncbi:MAG TPA: sulfurtransferase [Burkholderiaceae bacterium]|nr:sulfurtransferase [Burkholderiaceae bacterium]
MFETLIEPHALYRLANSDPGGILIVDCTFDSTDHQRGEAIYRDAHIPDAMYIDLETELSGEKSGSNGRHPLPSRTGFARRIADLGANDDTQIITYDRSGGAYAARAWWLLRWVGHRAVAVLDGGFGNWEHAEFPVTGRMPQAPAPGNFSVRESLARTVDRHAVIEALRDPGMILLDARSPDRFCGENETVDPAAGHIPGACNRFFHENLEPDGRFKSRARLDSEFRALIGTPDPARVVNMCGSGVAACHNLLALEIVGVKDTALYPGSWSEWCAYPGMPLAIGPDSTAGIGTQIADRRSDSRQPRS